MVGSGALGEKGGGIHSTLGALVFMAFLACTLAATVVELFTLPAAFRLFAREPSSKTKLNVACVVFAIAFLAIVCLWLLVQFLWASI
jgi:hypothetical protein